MWTEITRAKHARVSGRYSSDLTHAEWSALEPLLPPRSRLGRPPKWSLREIVEALMYLLRGGLPWRMLPKDFPPVSTVQRYFYAWRDSGLWLAISHLLLMSAREAAGREASPTAGVIDSQSVKTTESGGAYGYDAGEKLQAALDELSTVTRTIGRISGLYEQAARTTAMTTMLQPDSRIEAQPSASKRRAKRQPKEA